MNALFTLEQQHHALAAHMLRLVNMIDEFHGCEQAFPITVQLARLSHLLRVHLATEDEWFYPAMMRSTDPRAASLAARYHDEIGGLADAVEVFIGQWNSSTVIALGFERFRHEVLALFIRIEVRIGREEDELYPLARSLGIGAQALAA